jgi:hypothetical protein
MTPSEKELLEKITDAEQPWFERCIAIRTAGKLKMSGMEDTFLQILFEEKNFEVCGELAQALVKICGADDAVLNHSFGFMLDDENDATVYGAVTGLRLTNCEDYIGKLMLMVDSNRDVRLRRAAASALGELEELPDEHRTSIMLHELERAMEKPSNVQIRDTVKDTIAKIKRKVESETLKSDKPRPHHPAKRFIRQTKPTLSNK